VEIDPGRQLEARRNARIAAVSDKVTFIRSDIFDLDVGSLDNKINAAFVDPDWDDDQRDHVYRFIDSTTRPPSDWILDYLADTTSDITLVQPPFIDEREFGHLLPHELETLYLAEHLERYCLHFGTLLRSPGKAEFRI